MKFVKLTLLTVFAVIAFSSVVHANVTESAGFVIASQGTLTAVDQNGKVRELTRRSQFYANETLKTGANSQAQLRFKDRALMTLKPDSELNIGQYHFGGAEDPSNTAVMKLVSGGFRTISGSIGQSNKSAYRIDTPAASIGIRGTDYELIISIDGKLFAAVHGGGITIVNDLGDLDLGADSSYLFAEVSTGSSPKGLDEMPDVFKVEGGEKKELTPEQKAKLQQKLAEKQEKLQGVLAALNKGSDGSLADGDLQRSVFDAAIANDDTIDPRIDPALLAELKNGRYALLVNDADYAQTRQGRTINVGDEKLFLGSDGQLIRFVNMPLTDIGGNPSDTGHANVDWGIWNKAMVIEAAGVETLIKQDVVWMDAKIYDESVAAERKGIVNISGPLSGFNAGSTHPELVQLEGSSGFVEFNFTKQTVDGSVYMFVYDVSDPEAEPDYVGSLAVNFDGKMFDDKGKFNNNFNAEAQFGENTLKSGVSVKGTMVAPVVKNGDPAFAGFFSARLPIEQVNVGFAGLFTIGGGLVAEKAPPPPFLK